MLKNWCLFTLFIVSVNCLQSQDYVKSDLIFNHFTVSNLHPSLMSKNDSAEIRIMTHRNSGSKDYDYFAREIYPETTFISGSYETPLFRKKLAVGASAGYNHDLLRWVHGVPILHNEKSYTFQLQTRYRIGKTTFTGISFGYLKRINHHTVFSVDTSKYIFRQGVFHLSSGFAYYDKKSTFAMHLYWENKIMNASGLFRRNALFLNVFASRVFKNQSKSITFQPYMVWYSDDFLNSPEIYLFFLPQKTGITITKKPVFLNVDFGLIDLASFTLGCILFDKMFRVSLSYVFYDYYNHPQDIFKKEQLNITNIISYTY